jgi:hypothetical protein
MAEALSSKTGESAIEDVLGKYPPPTVTPTGRMVNTLNLVVGDDQIGLRSYYNLVETTIRHWLLRMGYPNAAPHATQAWAQHQGAFSAICAMSPGERTLLAQRLWDEVLGLEEMAGDSESPREVRPFEVVLRDFPNTRRGEPPGSVMQGLAYAYYRADSPAVQLITGKSGRGSSRVGAAGDVDGWIGDQLSLSVEVKDLEISDAVLPEFDQFLHNLSRWPNCTAVALALSFTESARAWLLERHVLAFDRERMAGNVAYWDVPKQKLAVQALLHYFGVIQQHPALVTRFKLFAAELEAEPEI